MKTSHSYLINQLSERLASDFNDFIVKQKCDHEWVEYGHGYKCEHCHHYSGLSELTKIIKAELTPAKDGMKEGG